MSLDLESRLHDYGADIDTAIDAPIVASAPRQSRWVRYGVPAVAAALVVVAAGVLIAGRTPERGGPAGGVTESTIDLALQPDDRLYFGPGDWEYMAPGRMSPVHLADDLVAWFALRDDAAAAFGSGPGPGASLWSTVRTNWHIVDDAVECSRLESMDEQPAVVYRDLNGRSVEISTSHSPEMDGISYLFELWYETYGSATEEPPSFEQVDIGSAHGSYGVDESRGLRMLAWTPVPSATVAVVTEGVSRDELFDLALAVVPVEEPSSIPLVLARADHPGAYQRWERDDRLVGAVVDGQVCAFSSEHILGDDQDSCLYLGEDPMLLTQHGQGGLAGRYAGLVSSEVDLIRFDFADGTQLTMRPTEQPVGEVQAFATFASGPFAAMISALDVDGNELMTIDVASLNERLEPDIPVTEPSE